MNSKINNLSDKVKHQLALINPAQMYQADQMAIESGISGANLMANAGAVVAKAIMRKWPKQPVLFICGAGNNGGDGFIAANLLKQAGWPVQLALFANLDDLQGDAGWAASQWQAEILDVTDIQIPDKGIIVDAILGAGLNRPISGALVGLIDQINKSNAYVCAIDVPTGLHGATGECDAISIKADLTVSFFRAKPGHYLMPGRKLCGEFICENIGIPAAVLEHIKPTVFKNHPLLWQESLHWPDLSDHKYKRGHVIVIGGGQLLGAARLSSMAAARIGAGLVTLAVPESAWAIQAACMTSVMVESSGPDLNKNLQDPRRNAIVIGPGLGLDIANKNKVLQALATKRKCVLDADALTLFADNPDELFTALHENCVLTPHAGEFGRLFGTTEDKLNNLKKAIELTGAVVLLKGADTVIGAPSGLVVINNNAPAYLATGGSGDVLSGAIAGLMATGMSPFLAACAAVWLHGQAANRAGLGLLAEDLPALLPRVLADLKNT